MKSVTVPGLGLDFVGINFADEFGKKMLILGLRASKDKVVAYRHYIDPTVEVSTQDLQAVTQPYFPKENEN